MLLYNTGARVQEIADLRFVDVDLNGPLRVRLHGKGDKWRNCPLWPETAALLKQLMTDWQCWRKDWKDDEAHLLPAKFLSAWIQTNLYLSLADAPFDREDQTLNPAAGACTTCPRRSGYNTALFSDVVSDQCLDGKCFQTKIAVHIDREIAARPELIQIENGWRNAKEQRPGAVQRGHFREIETVVENPDAEPARPVQPLSPQSLSMASA
jgi:hypothetical protein